MNLDNINKLIQTILLQLLFLRINVEKCCKKKKVNVFLYKSLYQDVISLKADRESFRKIGLTFEEKAFYDILMALRDEYNFEYGTDKIVDAVNVNYRCKALSKNIKEIIDAMSSITDWVNNQIVRNQLKFDINVCLIENGYPPQYSHKVFRTVME